ncbi:MAG TPA: ABC transporter permease [Bacteroidota bacterium]|nr:ABC transporter permease [Bacteroidota bacterium]
MRRIFYLVQKEFRQVFRDKSMIGILFVVPFIQLVLLGNAITTEVKHVRVLLGDRDGTPMSRAFLQSFRGSEYIDVVGQESDEGAIARALDRGDASVAVVLPRHFQRDVLRGERPAVQVLADGIDGNSAGVALGYVSGIAAQYQARLLSDDPALGRQLLDLRRVQAEPRFWFNPDLQSKVYVVPGIVALLLLIITVFLTSMGIVREKEIGTLEQLMVTPIRATQLILGKIIPFSILGMLEIAIAMGLVYVLFGIGVEGSLLLLFAESGLFILTTLGVGIFISTISETQQQALFVGWFFMIFAILLSGFFIPIANMPETVQYLTYLNPMRYFMVILREIYLKGSSLPHLLNETLAMLIFGVTVFSAAVWRYRVKLG